MLNKLPEEYVYEYVVSLDEKELAVYYSDAVPPELGTLLDPWEFVSSDAMKTKKAQFRGPFRVIKIKQQPKNMAGTHGEVSAQTLVNITVEN
jgi:hypothetical protein